VCIVAATPGAALGAPGRRDGCRGGRSPFSCAPRTSSGTAFGGRAFRNIAGNARPGTPSGTSPGTSPGTPVGTSSRPRGAARRGHLNGCRRRPYGPQAEDMRQGHRREHRRGAAFGNANGVAFQGMHAAPGGSGARRGRRNGCRRRQYGPQAEDVRQGHRRQHRREPRSGTSAGNSVAKRWSTPGNVVGNAVGHIVGSNVSGTAHSGIFERQPGTPPDRELRPNTVGNVAGNTFRCIVATGAAALGVRPGTAVLCRTVMADLVRTLESYFSAILVRAAPGNPDKCLQRSLSRQPCRKSWPSSVCVSCLACGSHRRT